MRTKRQEEKDQKQHLGISLKGKTRIVIVYRGVVIKVPKPLMWTNFLCGILANLEERDTFKREIDQENGHSHLLAPVIWCSWGGWVLIMKRARIITANEWRINSIKEHVWHFGGDDKMDNYGFIGNRLVKIDYGELD